MKNRKSTRSPETTDNRRARLEARRYHVNLVMEAQCLSLRHDGELFFDSLRAARAEVRKQYREWESWSDSTISFRPSDWREIWASAFFEVTLREGGEDAYHFRAQIIDTHAPQGSGNDRPFQLDFDYPEDPTESADPTDFE